jgi:ATP-dependent exoDNAse (exonuclease V) beta subunit
LEFDTVVLPELDKELIGQTPEFVAHRRDGTGSVDCVFKYVNARLQSLLPERFQQMIAAATDRDVTESLCLLYVALTRAVHALHMIIRPAKENQRNPEAMWSGLLQHARAGGKPATAATKLWEHGDSNWFKKPGDDDKRRTEAAKTLEKAEKTPLIVRVAPPAASARRSLDRAAPSRLHAVKTLSLDRIFAEAENTYAKDRGSVLHACFEQVEWLDDALPERATLRRIAREHAGASVNIDHALDDFFAIVKRSHVRQALSRSAYRAPLNLPLSPSVLAQLARRSLVPRVRREHEFALICEGQLVAGSIDRLVLLYDGDTPAAADILDFKTDAMIIGAADRHREQLRAYRDAVSRLFQLPPDHIAMRLLMVKDGTIVNIT